jgi:hypothetical protein
MKLCKDCRHFKHIAGTPYDACRHEGAARNPVSGRAFAEFERTAIGNCKAEGNLFEQRPARVSFFKRIFG